MDLITNVVGGSQAKRVLLLAHGYGADERDLGGLLTYLDPDGHFLSVFPRGPVAAPPGFAWYEFGAPSPGGGLAFDQAGFAAAVDAVDDLLDATCAEHGLPRDEAIVGGFSQGAGIALALALRSAGRIRPAGVVAMSPALPDLELIEPDWAAAATMPILLQHGTEDPLIPVDRSRALARTLAEHSVPVVFSEYPMAHQVALESVQQAKSWLDAVRGGESPSEPIPEDPPEPLVKPVTSAAFDAEVMRSELPVIVDFWAPWCQPCRQVSPIVEQIAAMRRGSYKVVKVNIDEEPALAKQFEVQSIPMIGLFRNGRLERAALGAKPRQQLEAELGMLVIP